MADSLKVTKGMQQVASPYRVKKTDRQHPDSGGGHFPGHPDRKKKKRGPSQEEMDDIVEIQGRPAESSADGGEEQPVDEGNEEKEHHIDIRI